MPKDGKREREHYLRTRWLFSLLYLCGLRISEVVENSMGGFFCRRDRNGDERWWLEVVGKGDKTRIVPATNELMVELARYRRKKGLVALPLHAETTPLLLPLGAQQRPMTRGGVHSVVNRYSRARQRDWRVLGQRIKQRHQGFAKPRHTGFAIRLAPIWLMVQSIFVMSATTSATSR